MSNPGNRDPWSQSGDQGPPDLDDAFRKLQDSFGKFFGGGKSGGSGGGGGSGMNFLKPKYIGFAVVILGAVWAAMGVYTVDAQEQGVVFRLGEVQAAAVQPGLRWNPYLIDQVEIVNVTRVNTQEHSAQMLTEDENIVDVKLVVQYIVDQPLKNVVEVRDADISLQHATESALRHVVGSSKMDDIITEGRELLARDVQVRLQAYIDLYQTGITVNKVNVDNVGPPAEVQDAFDDVQKAKEDLERIQNEATAYAQAIVPEARGTAQQLVEEARAYRDQKIAQAEGEADRFSKLLTEYKLAPEVTRERLFIDAVQSVYSDSNVVMVDVEGGNNMMVLPLDQIRRITENAGAGGMSNSTALAN